MMSEKAADLATAPCHFPTYQEIVTSDALPAPPVLSERSDLKIDIDQIPREHYTSLEFAKLEIERMWPRVWQIACREEQVPEVGDCHVFEIATYSILVVRSAPDRIQAYFNSCPHRGMKLCQGDTALNQIRCAFHGFTWSLDGRFLRGPASWEFRQLREGKFPLPEIRVGSWGGFIFINMNKDADPLEQYLANLPAHFAEWDYADYYLVSYIQKEFRSNWKCGIEAFIESLHTTETHPQLPFSGDVSIQYEVWPGNDTVSRFCQPVATLSEVEWEKAARNGMPSTGDIVDRMTKTYQRPTQIPIDSASQRPDAKARSLLAEASRAEAKNDTGLDFSGLSDTEVLDVIEYSLFPNIVLFRSLSLPLAYRFRPIHDDPNRCIFDLFIFARKPVQGPVPLAAEPRFLGPDDSYTESGLLPGWLGQVFDQDTENLAQQQAGLRAGIGPIILSDYQEVRIRHLHQTLRKYVFSEHGTLRVNQTG
jgi:phenylpropionate dioxygenase-like ring-hydroxylating dioxygenase large terminal subunit